MSMELIYEEWRYIKRYEGRYIISNRGNVMSFCIYRDGRPMTPCTNSFGYLRVTIRKDDEAKTKNIHVLVALAFIPNPYNKPMVNHIDGNKANPNFYNLEWVTRSENEIHARKTGLKRRMTGEHMACKSRKAIIQKTLSGDVVKIWPSSREAERYGFNSRVICAILKGRRHTHKNYKWEYA
jgi:hypothetical protein